MTNANSELPITGEIKIARNATIVWPKTQKSTNRWLFKRGKRITIILNGDIQLRIANIFDQNRTINVSVDPPFKGAL